MIFYTDECEERIGYAFKDKVLLRTCFTHTSYANEHNVESNERLEFLGDSILNFVVADHLFKNIGANEGELTRRRAELVSANPIGNAIVSLGVDKFLLRGEGEKNGPVKLNMCADLFEAIVAGIYIDGGLECARKFILDNLIKKKRHEHKEDDFKSKLQELVQKHKIGRIEYTLIDKRGPDHAPQFTCKVSVGGTISASGVGPNKKQAEQLAAKAAIKKIETKKLENKRGKSN